MTGNTATAKKQGPQLASNIESFDGALRLLIAVAARAAANLQLSQDASLPNEDIKSITEGIAAYSVDDTPPSPTKSSSIASPKEKERELSEKEKESGDTVAEVDAQEVQEVAQAIAAATAEQTKPRLSPEELRRERENLKASIDKVEAANAEAARARKKQALIWADEVARHCQFDPQALPPKPRAADLKPAIKGLSREKHHEILHDVLMLSLHLPPPSKDDTAHPESTKQAKEKAPKNAGVYTALSRYLVFAFAQILGIPPITVYDAEKAMAQQLYFVFEETKKAEEEEHEKGSGGSFASRADSSQMKLASQGAIAEREKKNSTWKWAATGAGFLAGGVILGVTGGLAAPLLAPLLVTATGGALSFLATSGGAVLLGTMFGLTGGGLTAFRAKRRMEGIEEFEFVKVEDPDMPHIPSLSATIISSGFLVKEDDWIAPYKETFLHDAKDKRDVFVLKAESTVMLQAGKSLDSYVKNFLINKGITEIIKRTALAAVFSAIALPATVYKTATKTLDNDFQRSTDRAQKAGIILADVLEKGVQGNRPTILIGSSLGAVTIMTCLLELHKRGLGGLVFDAILISLPAAPTPAEWLKMRQVTSRRLVNAYSSNDWVLAIMARLHTLISTKLSFGVAGLAPVKLGDLGDEHNPIVENIDLSDILNGHLELAPKMTQVLERIGIER